MADQSKKLLPSERSHILKPPSPEHITSTLKIKSLTIDWLAGDGSDRCYYRLRSPDLNQPLVLMQLSEHDAQALRSGGYEWIKIAKILKERGIFIPHVIASLHEHAALIIEDYGDVMLEGLIFNFASSNDIGKTCDIYRKCFHIISDFLLIPRDTDAVWCQRAFDAERFAWELNFFMQKYGLPVAGLDLNVAEKQQFLAESQMLSSVLAENSQYFVHRDFHSRNIMAKDDRLAIIDFQDARLGPAAYDLVSLCFDSYVPLTGPLRSQLMDDAFTVIRQKCGPQISQEVELLWKPLLLQRQLKAIGSFGSLTLDKKRGDYLKYVDPAVRTLEEQDLYDDRWPFLSSVLISKLRSYLDSKEENSR